MTAELISKTKIGATSIATVSGVTVEQAERTGLRVKRDGENVDIYYTNKSEYGEIIDMIDAVNAAPSESPKTSGARYIERADVARVNGLNHGKTWIATGYDVDARSIDPSMEGEEICYVYQN